MIMKTKDTKSDAKKKHDMDNNCKNNVYNTKMTPNKKFKSKFTNKCSLFGKCLEIEFCFLAGL
jgi:hypothetical protein